VADESKKKNSIQDTDFELLDRRRKRKQLLKDPLRKKRHEAMAVPHKIINGVVDDNYSIKHTGKTRQELLDHLGIPNGVIPPNFQVDHIKRRCEFVSDADFERINWYDI
jgi:hypothetical protein